MQKKGKFGLLLSFYAILAFIFVILKMPVLCAGLFIFVLLAEKDEWTGRQVLEALMLSLTASFFINVFDWASLLIPDFSFFSHFFHIVFSVLSALVYIAAVVLSILGILRVMREQEADVPLLADFAYKAYGKVKPRRAPSPMPSQYQQPTYGTQQNQPPYAPSYQQPPYGAPQQQPPFSSQPPQNGTDQQPPLP